MKCHCWAEAEQRGWILSALTPIHVFLIIIILPKFFLFCFFVCLLLCVSLAKFIAFSSIFLKMYKMYYNSNKTSRRCVVANRPRKRNKENGVGMAWCWRLVWCWRCNLQYRSAGVTVVTGTAAQHRVSGRWLAGPQGTIHYWVCITSPYTLIQHTTIYSTLIQHTTLHSTLI